MQKITPYLWFDTQAQEAATFYTSIFKNSKIINTNPVMVSFELDGQNFIALNGGPNFKFTEAVSFFVNCEDQKEVDYYWEKLSAHPENEQCGWLKDKYGLSWQIVPKQLGELMGDSDREKANRVMQAMLKMKKMDISELQKAYEGK
ncbi:VOC family protein [soil metagenome]